MKKSTGQVLQEIVKRLMMTTWRTLLYSLY